MLKLIETVWRTKFTFYFWVIRKLKIVRKYTGSRPIAPQLLSCDQNNSQIRDPRRISDRINVFKIKSMTWPKKNFSELYPSIFAIFDDFRVFWMDKWTLPHFSRGSRKSGSFLRQLNGYLAMSTFRNRKYRTVLFFQIWKMSSVP
jgi:hypothetical protein